MNPTKVPIQICLRITRRSFLTRAACSPSSGPAASSRRSCGARRPVVISCSTKERRTETIRAASIVSPVSGSQHHKSLDIALAFWGHVNVKSLHDARTYFALDSRKTMKKIGTSKTLFVMVGKRSSGVTSGGSREGKGGCAAVRWIWPRQCCRCGGQSPFEMKRLPAPQPRIYYICEAGQ